MACRSKIEGGFYHACAALDVRMYGAGAQACAELQMILQLNPDREIIMFDADLPFGMTLQNVPGISYALPKPRYSRRT